MSDLTLTSLSTLTYEEGPSEVIREKGSAKYRYEEATSTHHLQYTESGQGVKTLLSITEDRVRIRRYGEETSTLEIVLGEEKEAFFKTPYGVLPMVTEGRRLSVLLDQKGRGKIHLIYGLSIDGQVRSQNEIELTVR